MKKFKLKTRNVLLASFLAIAGLLGVGTIAIDKQAIKEARADSEDVSCIVMWARDEIGWTDAGHGLYIKFNNVTFPTNFYYKNSFSNFIGDGKDGITKDGSGNYYCTLIYGGNDGCSYFSFALPWYIQSFSYTIGRTNSDWICAGQKQGDYYTNNWATATKGEYRKDYLVSNNYTGYYSTGTTSGGTATKSTVYYTVTHSLDSGTGVATSQKVYQYGMATNPGSPTKTGYSFTKWTTAGSSDEYGFNTEITDSSVTLYANYSINQYTLTFNTAGGSSIDSITQDYDSIITPPSNPTRTGYTFNGWSPSIPSRMPGENLTITASWTPNTYNITYKDRGDVTFSGTHQQGYATTHTYGTATSLDSPTKSGYVFDGWFTESTCPDNKKVTSLGATTYTSDITLYAKFREIPSSDPIFYLVGNSTFNQSSGIGGTASWYEWEYNGTSQLLTYGTQDTKTTGTANNVYLQSGSQLKTRIKKNGTDTIYNDTYFDNDGWHSDYVTAGTSKNIVINTSGYYNFFAKEDTALKISISYIDLTINGKFFRNADDASPVYTEANVTKDGDAHYNRVLYNDSYNPDFSSWTSNPTGDAYNITYSFVGFYTDSDLTEAYVPAEHVTSSFTLYAKFVDHTNYVTYHHNDGSGNAKADAGSYYGTEHTVKSFAALDWTDSFFRSLANWNTATDGSGTKYSVGSKFDITGAVTLYAQQNWHQVFISIDGGDTWHSTTTTFPDGMQIQYENTEPFVVDEDTAELCIKYKNVNTNVETEIDLDDSSLITFEGNNYDASTHGFNVSYTGKIYLKVTTDNKLKCYIPGATDRTIVIVHKNGNETPVGTYQRTSDQFASLGYVYLRAGEKIRAKYKTESSYNTWLVTSDLGDGDGCENVDESGTNVVRCTTTGAYTIYLQEGSTHEWHDVVVQRDEAESAAYFARLFNRDMSAICSSYNTNTVNSFKDAWQLNATENAVTVFGELSDECQEGLQGNIFDEDSDVAAFKAKYDYILSKYDPELKVLNNFLERDIPTSAAFRYSPFSLGGDGAVDATTIIIVIASSVALLSVTALSILVIKKRKREQE